MRGFTSKISLFIILLLSIQCAFAQKWRPEVKKLIDSGIANAKDNPQQAINSVIDAFEIAKTRKDLWAVSNSKSAMGYISTVQRDYKAAFVNYTEALEFLEKADTTDLPNEMVVHQNLARISSKYKDFDQAAFHYAEAEKIAIEYKKRFPVAFERNGHAKTLIDFPYRRALIYRDQGDYVAAGKILLPMWDKTRADQDTVAYARVLNQLGLVQKTAGDAQEAEYYFGLVIAAEGIKPSLRAIAMHNMGATFLAAGEYDRAKGYFDRALAMKVDPENKISKRSQFITHLDMGELYYRTGQTQAAIDTWNSGLSIFDKVEGEPDLFEVYNWLTEAHIQLGSKKASEYNRQYASLNRSWRAEQERLKAQNSSQQLQLALDSKKAQIEAGYADDQQLLYYFIFAGLILIASVTGVVYYYKSRAARRKKLAMARAAEITDGIDF